MALCQWSNQVEYGWINHMICWALEKHNKIKQIKNIYIYYITLKDNKNVIIIPPQQRSCWGVYWFHSVRLSVRPSVRLSRLACPLCNIYSSGWILSILATNDHYHERVCRTQWPLTLTYIFKVIRPWLRKSCPLCSVYSSGWILFIFGTNDHYH